jgi:hypothetical protein
VADVVVFGPVAGVLGSEVGWQAISPTATTT